MKILIVTDTHIHTWKSFDADRDTMLSKQLSVQDDILNRQIINLINDNGVSLLLHGGDWFQNVNQIPVECLNIVNKFLNKIRSIGVRDESCTGNHDLVKRVAPEWYHNVVNVFRNPESDRNGNIFEVGGVKIGFINYEDEVDFKKFSGLDIVIVHKTPAGAVYCNHTFNDGVDWKVLSENNRFVFFGHIHQHQELAHNCFVVGPPMAFNFGESGEHGVYLIDTDIWSIEFIKLDSPEFRTVEYIEQVIDDYNYYRVLNSDSTEKKSNAIIINNPRTFDERIKSDSVIDVINEWVSINGKGESFVKLIQDQLSKVEGRTQFVKDYTLSEVEISDFISVGNINYFLNHGLTLISGRSEGFSSNGSGKTAIVDAIYWALTGKTTKGLVGDDVIRRGCKDCEVNLKLEKGEDGIFISRSRKQGLSISSMFKGMIVKDLTAGLKQQDRQALLEQLLGFGENLYMASCYFSQESLTMLTDMSDVDRTNMVSGLLGFNIYDELYVWVSEMIKAQQSYIAKFDESKVFISNKISNVKVAVGMHERAIISDNERIKQCNEVVARYKKEIGELKMHAFGPEKEDKNDYDKLIDECNEREVELNQTYRRQVDTISELEGNRSKVNSKIVQLQTRGQIIKSDIAKLRHKIDELSSLKFNERCDKCGALMTAENADLFKSEMQVELDTKEKELNELLSEIVIFDGEVAGINNQMTVGKKLKLNSETELRELKSKINELNRLKLKQIERKNEMANAKAAIDYEIKEREALIKTYVSKIDDYTSNIEGIKLELNKCKSDIELFESQLFKIDEDKDVLNKNIEIYDFWKVAFSPKGIKSLLLDKFCNDINVIINGCLSVISNGVMGITVTPTATTKAGEERNKLGIEISIGDSIVKYESLSGGEKRRVDFSLCMAMNDYVSNKFKLSSGLLGLIVMDELFSYLDKSGEELIGQYLVQASKNRSIFVITHTDELTSYADRCWTVAKENNISKLEVS